MTTMPAPLIVPLEQADQYGPDVVGAKAHTLGRLIAAGFPVPDGFVVTTRARQSWEETLAQAHATTVALGLDRVAVRSSGSAEDLADASFAGQYDTVLDVPVDQLPAALEQVLASVDNDRVASYRAADPRTSAMAALVQRMVAADAAGVAFTANPLTGRRAETIVTAVRGTGERLVSGQSDGDTWVVRGTEGERLRAEGQELSLSAAQAIAVATLASQIARLLGQPQDIEWAIAGSALFLLQARPITALPTAVTWNPPGPGRWMRNFRVGEWLPDPVTPLFETWLLPRLDAGLHAAMRATAGAVLPFRHATINGWYYTALPHPPVRRVLTALLHSRGRLLPFTWHALVQVNRRPDGADHALLGELTRRWREEHLPAYRRCVATAAARVPDAGDRELAQLVDDLGHAAGEQLWWLELLGGAAWKMEACLAGFCGRRLPAEVDPGVQVLLAGLAQVPSTVPDHAVQSLDWYHATAGELGSPTPLGQAPRRPDVAARRLRAEAACRAALAGQPAHLRRFDALLDVAQRYAVLREEQAHTLTLAWPALRSCVLRLGDRLCARDAITHRDDVFFLHERELRSGDDRRTEARARREEWRLRRRLTAPLTVGTDFLVPDVVAAAVARVTRGAAPSPHAIVGQPASSGRATGAVCIVRGPEDFAGFRSGEILVARTTAPAWTPLLARAAAVVTDGGSLAAHASLIAREYGIPAVVATGDATVRLRQGQVVTVDGGAGIVEPAYG